MFAPLTGYRVIDVTQVLAGPYCTYQLGLLGADVIKVELPGIGDWTRAGGGDAELSEAGMGTGFLTQNANKKSVTLNLKTPQGAEILKKLIAGADVFIENFKPGTAASLGIGYDDVRHLNPRLVYGSISAYGQDAPSGTVRPTTTLFRACPALCIKPARPRPCPIKSARPTSITSPASTPLLR